MTVFSTSENVAGGSTTTDTSVIGVVSRIRVEQSLKLSLSRALEVTTTIFVLSGTVQDRANLRCDNAAVERNDLVTEIGIVQVHGPGGVGTIVCLVDLTVRRSTEKVGSLVLATVHQLSFTKIDSIAGSDDATSNTEWRFADSH